MAPFRRCGGQLVALQTTEAVVPGSNPASLTVKYPEDRHGHCAMCIPLCLMLQCTLSKLPFVWFFVIYFVKCPQNNSKLVALSLEAPAKSWRQHSDIICCSKKKIVSLISNYDDCIYCSTVYHIYILFLAGLFANKWTMKMKILQYLFSRDGTKIYFGKHFGKIYIFKIKKFRLYFFVRKE